MRRFGSGGLQKVFIMKVYFRCIESVTTVLVQDLLHDRSNHEQGDPSVYSTLRRAFSVFERIHPQSLGSKEW